MFARHFGEVGKKMESRTMELSFMRIMRIALAVVVLIWIGAGAASARHSAAAQDFTKRVEVEGVIKVGRSPTRTGELFFR
jgi:hypothetical protein